MVKCKANVIDDINIQSEKLDPPRSDKHSYIYYFKIESQKLKEEGVKVDETVCRQLFYVVAY